MQLVKLYPGFVQKSVRGNVLTRLEKLDRGEYCALILAKAGLVRLGLEDRISKEFTPEEMVPAAGQGIMVVQGRQGEDYRYWTAWMMKRPGSKRPVSGPSWLIWKADAARPSVPVHPWRMTEFGSKDSMRMRNKPGFW